MMATVELRASIATQSILGVNVAVSSYDEVVQHSLAWAGQRESRALCFANVHVIMEAADDPAFLLQLNSADMVNPDGVPLVWALHALGERGATRVCGPDFMALMLAAAEREGVPVGFYGASQATLDALVAAVRLQHPKSRRRLCRKPAVPAADS